VNTWSERKGKRVNEGGGMMKGEGTKGRRQKNDSLLL